MRDGKGDGVRRGGVGEEARGKRDGVQLASARASWLRRDRRARTELRGSGSHPHALEDILAFDTEPTPTRCERPDSQPRRWPESRASLPPIRLAQERQRR